MAWKFACMLRTNRKCDPTVGFSKYEFNNKLLVGVIFFRVTSSVTWTQPYISWSNGLSPIDFQINLSIYKLNSQNKNYTHKIKNIFFFYKINV